jgi:hypothetical protein
MTPATRFSTALAERLDGLPSVPPERYLAAARSAGRRRRRQRWGVASGVAAAAAVVLVAGSALPPGDGPQRARERQPSVATRPAQAVTSLSSLVVQQGVGDIDSYTTDEIPDWATEYGHHGPAAIAPDGRLWIAPEASVVRSIDDPFAGVGETPAGIAHSYALELRWQGPDEALGKDGLVWSFIYQQDDGSTGGELDTPERWTADFALWADNLVASTLDRPKFAERLVQFADDRSDLLVPGAGVEIVRQVSHAGTGDRQQYARETAAEVRVGGQTWFVFGTGRQVGHAFYEAYDEPSSGASDLDGFLRFTSAGFVDQGGSS